MDGRDTKHGHYPTSTKFNNLDHLKQMKDKIPHRGKSLCQGFLKWWETYIVIYIPLE